MTEGVSLQQCQAAQKACRDSVETILDARLGGIEESQGRVERLLESHVGRVGALEVWKGQLNGAAAAQAAQAAQAAKAAAAPRQAETFLERNWLTITALMFGILAGDRALPILLRLAGVK